MWCEGETVVERQKGLTNIQMISLSKIWKLTEIRGSSQRTWNHA